MDLMPPVPADLDLDPADVSAEYDRRGLRNLSDDDLFDIAARVVSVPKRDPADSFGLHAPLELLARRALLSYVHPADRDAVRERMLWVAARYRRAGDPAAPAEVHSYASTAAARFALLVAIDHGDLAGVDAAALWLTEHASPETMHGLAAATVDSLAAAGHASIYFSLVPRVAPPSRSALALFRPLIHELARVSSLRVEWIRSGIDAPAADGRELARVLATTPRLGLPGSDFIFPIVHQVDSGGMARELLGSSLPADVEEATRTIVRVAAQSMLQDDPASAPYGWTHCLTLPQAVLANAGQLREPTLGIAIAATYVLGFRAALGRRDIDLDLEPDRVDGSGSGPFAALDGSPAEAAAAVYHASAEDLHALVPSLAADGGAHEDAHVAKYTLACFDAAGRDPAATRLYLAAAAYLHAWWRHS